MHVVEASAGKAQIDRTRDARNAAGIGFDRAAASYDDDFTNKLLGRLIRQSVRRELSKFPAGAAVLELGCGTGEDAVWLAKQGYTVTAIDASAEMLRTTRAKADAAGVAVEVLHVDMRCPGSALQGRRFDAAFSNFGPLNCVTDRRGVASWLAGRLRSGAPVVAVVMGPFCPWEWAWHGLHGDLKAATRRLRGHSSAHAGGGGFIDVLYPSATRLQRETRPWFKHDRTRGIGFFLPPSDAAHVVDAAPRLFRALATLEMRLDRLPPARWFNDHYLTVLTCR
jgi:SAM-dependent methyltransferase